MISSFAQFLAKKVNASEEDKDIVRPVFFRLVNTDERQQLENLISNNPSIRLYDRMSEQLAELMAIKNLSQHKNAVGAGQLIEAHLNHIPMEEYGVWVFYPWLNKIVHILDEEEFIEVRTNRNQHKITKGELAVLRKKKIGIIGLSVGQSIASTLMLERCCGELRLADFDDLELSNLNRIKTGLYNLGLKKIVQVAREIAEVDPYINVVCCTDGITEANIDDFLVKDGKLDLLIEECDSLDIKILSRVKARQYGIPVVMETNDRGMVDIERFDLNPEYPLLHNLIENISWEGLKNLTTEQKVPVMMKLVGFSTVSARGRLTLLELGQSIATWPQLASTVVMGAGIVTDVARRILLKQLSVSGRFYIDVESIIRDAAPPGASYTPPVLKELTRDEMLSIAGTIAAGGEVNHQYPSEDFIKAVVRDAATAPSSGNDQPWKFLYNKGSLFLFHEAARSYSFGDYKNRASYISLGAAIENVVLSAHYHQREVAVQLFPKAGNDKCVAVFNFKSAADGTTEKRQQDGLYPFITERYTNRKVVPNDPAPEAVLQQLLQAAESIKGATAYFVSDKDNLQALGTIISAGDRIRIMDPQGHYDFFNREVRWTTAEAELKRNGMDVATLELPPTAQMALQLVKNDTIINVLRDINGLQAFKNTSVPNAVNAAAMGLITMPSFDATDFINGGRAVQRQWLKATALGYAYHPMVVPLYLFYRTVFGNGEGLNLNTFKEVNDLHKRFLQVFPGNEQRGEILLFRIFRAENVVKRSLRLPLNEILFT